MDLGEGKSVLYRNFDLNSVSTIPGQGIGSGLAGCQLDSVDWSDLDVVQFTEKRALSDGLDVGPPTLGGRRMTMTGTLYGVTRALLYDNLRELRATLNPVLAYREEPGSLGYLPMYFSEPTNDIDNWPDGAIPMRVLVMPHNFQASTVRNATGGDDGDSLALPWSALLTMRDPRLYAECPIEIPFTPTQSVSDNVNNPGAYPTPVNGLWVVSGHAGTITIAIGDSQLVITIPTSSGERIVRMKGDDKVLTFEENDVEVLAMDAIAFQNSTTWPQMTPGSSAYSVTFGGGLVLADTNSMLWFWPAWI
jgi:hypothetical protein